MKTTYAIVQDFNLVAPSFPRPVREDGRRRTSAPAQGVLAGAPWSDPTRRLQHHRWDCPTPAKGRLEWAIHWRANQSQIRSTSAMPSPSALGGDCESCGTGCGASWSCDLDLAGLGAGRNCGCDLSARVHRERGRFDASEGNVRSAGEASAGDLHGCTHRTAGRAEAQDGGRDSEGFVAGKRPSGG